MVDAIARLLAWKLSLYYRNPMGTTTLVSQGGGTSKYPAGRSVTFNVISGHRDAGNTECPGTNLYKQLANIRTLTEELSRRCADQPGGVGRPGGRRHLAHRHREDHAVPAVAARRAQPHRRHPRPHADRFGRPGQPVSAVWDQRDSTGAASRPGAYDLSLSSSSSTGSARTWNHRVALLPPTQPARDRTRGRPAGDRRLRTPRAHSHLRQPDRRPPPARPRPAT